MKKGIFSKLLLVLVWILFVACIQVPVVAGIDLEGELNYEIGDVVVDSYTQMAASFTPDPFDFKLTWRRDWIPELGDSLLMDAGVSVGDLRLGYTRELLEVDVGTASLKLTKDPLTIEYARLVDGLDLGTLTFELAVAPFTVKYTNIFDSTSGTLFVRFEKSL